MKKIHTVLAIGDLHCPFEHRDALSFLRALKKKYSPTRVVLMGDEMDAHALSEHDHDPDGLSAGHELEAARERLRSYYKLFPNAEVCESNHTSRPYRRAYKCGIPRELLKHYREFLRAPESWNWHQKLEIDGVVYEHGEPYSGRDAAIKCAMANFKPTVIGHVHSFAGVQFYANQETLLFGFNVGCLIDTPAYAFAYQTKIKSKPIIGAGIIEKGVPHFIPMLLDRRGRWTGRLS